MLLKAGIIGVHEGVFGHHSGNMKRFKERTAEVNAIGVGVNFGLADTHQVDAFFKGPGGKGFDVKRNFRQLPQSRSFCGISVDIRQRLQVWSGGDGTVLKRFLAGPTVHDVAEQRVR